jgi:hypothetical protein
VLALGIGAGTRAERARLHRQFAGKGFQMTIIRIAFVMMVSIALAWVTFVSLANAAERGRTLADYNIQKESTVQPPLRR